MANDEKTIGLSTSRRAMLLAASLVMTGLGVWFAAAGEQSSLIITMRRFVPPVVVHALGVVAAVFFAGCAVFAARKLFDPKPGLVLNSEGVVDNSSGVAAGFIPWSEVTGVSVLDMGRQRMVAVHVADPQKYLGRGNALKRALVRGNMGMCGTPIVISPTVLDTTFDELMQTLHTYLSRYAAPAAGGVAADVHPAP